MIFWSGKGFFSILFVLLGIMITQGAMEAVTGLKPAQQNHDLMWAFSFTLASLANGLFVWKLSKSPKRIVVDKATGEEMELSTMGSLFFIPTKWWTHIFAAVAAICFIMLLFTKP